MLAFLTAVYNEQEEIFDLLSSVGPHVDLIIVSDDGSTDDTDQISAYTLQEIHNRYGVHSYYVKNEHIGSCEETRIAGFKLIQPLDSAIWVLILDADERIPTEHLSEIRAWTNSEEAKLYTHVYFSQDEYIDGILQRSFAKIKMARSTDLHLPEGIHNDISASGDPVNKGWKIIHRKTSEKQKMRELEYLNVYEKQVAEGKMTRQRADEVSSWHYFIKRLPNG